MHIGHWTESAKFEGDELLKNKAVGYESVLKCQTLHIPTR